MHAFLYPTLPDSPPFPSRLFLVSDRPSGPVNWFRGHHRGTVPFALRLCTRVARHGCLDIRGNIFIELKSKLKIYLQCSLSKVKGLNQFLNLAPRSLKVNTASLSVCLLLLHSFLQTRAYVRIKL